MEAMSYYMNAVTILLEHGFLRSEIRGGTNYVAPTHAGYQWVERSKRSGKYLGILGKVIDNDNIRRERECLRASATTI